MSRWVVLDWDDKPLPGSWPSREAATEQGLCGKYLLSGYRVTLRQRLSPRQEAVLHWVREGRPVHHDDPGVQAVATAFYSLDGRSAKGVMKTIWSLRRKALVHWCPDRDRWVARTAVP